MNKLILISFFLVNYAFAAMTAKEIMQKNEEARRLDYITAPASMKTGGGGSADKEKKFIWWRALSADGVHFNTLTRFQFPADIKGEGILFLEKEGDQADVQLYLPAYKKIRRVESGQQRSSFMGSEFSYADIAAPHVSDFNFVMKPEAPCPGLKQQCYVVESTPATESVKDRTGISKSVSWVRKDNFMAVKVESEDLDGKPWKTIESSNIKEVDPKKHKWMSLTVKVQNTKNGRYTILSFKDVKVNEKIPESTFTPQNLSREK